MTHKQDYSRGAGIAASERRLGAPRGCRFKGQPCESKEAESTGLIRETQSKTSSRMIFISL